MVSPGAYHFVDGDGSHHVQVKGMDREFQSFPLVPLNKTAVWGNMSELELLGRTAQEPNLSSSACMALSHGLGGAFGMQTRDAQMNMYMPGSDASAESVHTLHLMGPTYTGYHDVPHNSNVVLMNSSITGPDSGTVGNHNHDQQQYVEFSPASIAQNSLAQQGNIYDTAPVSQANVSAAILANKFGNSSGNWTGVNELSFFPSADGGPRVSQAHTVRMSSLEPGQGQPNPNVFPMDLRAHQPLPEEQASILQHQGIGLGLNMNNSNALNQGLTLSLSAENYPMRVQYYSVDPEEAGLTACQGIIRDGVNENRRDEGYSQKWIGSLNELRASSLDGAAGLPYHCTVSEVRNGNVQPELNNQAAFGIRGLLDTSKYLRAAQLLLEEVVNFGCGGKAGSCRPTKVQQSWIVKDGSNLTSSSVKDGLVSEMAGNDAREGMACVVSSGNLNSFSEHNAPVTVQRTPQESQDLQMKKAKLIAMLEEVDRRYKLYFSQMEAIVHTFETSAGLGAAKTYTAVALQTISKHFCGLRDAIGGQIRAASRALGEEESSPGLGRLRYPDQQLQQQRHAGMMQQPAWRPQRGLPERSVSVLRAWLFEHFLHPYPKDADKHMLARQTGLSRNQVSNWFINARVRLWKPMVEEMYLEEVKDAEVDKSSTEQKSNTENSDNHISDVTGMDDQCVGNPDSNNRSGRDEAGSKDSCMVSGGKNTAIGYENGAFNTLGVISTADAEGDHQFQGAKKARNTDVLESYPLRDLKPEVELMNGDKHGFSIRGMGHAFEQYSGGGQGFLAAPTGYNGVSLTLGLQHSEGRVVSGSQPHHYYLPHQQQEQLHQLAVAGNRQHLEGMSGFYSVEAAKNYDALSELQAAKHFGSHLLHQT